MSNKVSNFEHREEPLMTARASTRGTYDVDVPPDRGCWVAPKCEDCWLRECILILSPAEGRRIKDALTVLQLFARPEMLSR